MLFMVFFMDRIHLKATKPLRRHKSAKSTEIPDTYFVLLLARKMKGSEINETLSLFWTWDLWVCNPHFSLIFLPTSWEILKHDKLNLANVTRHNTSFDFYGHWLLNYLSSENTFRSLADQNEISPKSTGLQRLEKSRACKYIE